MASEAEFDAERTDVAKRDYRLVHLGRGTSSYLAALTLRVRVNDGQAKT